MKECNECKRFKCRVIQKYRKDMKNMTERELEFMTETFRQSCPTYLAPRPWKTKMIFHLMQKNPQEVHDLLRGFNIRFQELAEKPWFRLIHKVPGNA